MSFLTAQSAATPGRVWMLRKHGFRFHAGQCEQSAIVKMVQRLCSGFRVTAPVVNHAFPAMSFPAVLPDVSAHTESPYPKHFSPVSIGGRNPRGAEVPKHRA